MKIGQTTKKVEFNIIFSLLGQIITVVISIVVPRLFIVSFGSEVNGFINSLNQIFVYVALLEAGVGGASLQALYKPVSEDNRDEINGILSATHHFYIRTGYFYLLAILLIAFIYPLTVETDLSYGLMFALICAVGMSGVIPYFIQAKYRILLQAEGKNYVSTIISTLQSILLSSGRLILLLMHFNVLVVQSVYFVVNLAMALVCVVYIRRNYKWINLKAEPNIQSISQKKYVVLHQISSLIFNNTDVLILTYFCNLSMVSIYVLYKNMIGMVGKIFDNILSSVNFKLGQTFHNKERFIPMVNAFEVFFVTLTFSICLSALYFITPFMDLYTENMDINYMIPYLPQLMVLVELLNYGRMISLNIINYAGHFKQTVPKTMIESSINLGLSLILVIKFGIVGVVIGTVVALLYRTIDMILYSNQVILDQSPWRSIKIWVNNAIITAVVYVVLCRIPIPVDTYLHIVLSAGIVTAIVVPMQVLLVLSLNRPAYQYIKGFLLRTLQKQ